MAEVRGPDDLLAHLVDLDRLVRAVASGRSRTGRPPWRRVEMRPVVVGGSLHLQITSTDDRRAFTRQVAPDGIPAAVTEILRMPFGTWLVEAQEPAGESGRRWQLRAAKSGAWRVHVEDTGPVRRDVRHDRVKQRMLDPADPVLVAVGISTEDGRIRAARRDKFHQVDEFLRIIAGDLEDPRLPRDRPVRIVDLGCGNAYLTFATAALLRAQGRPASIVGVDRRAEARSRNEALVAALGLGDMLGFVDADISDADAVIGADVVLALHACDTATDDALARAVEARATVILAAPCCHHDVQRQLRERHDRPAWAAAVLRDGILRERLGDVLTDAIRAQVLREHGYRVEVVEFVDSRHTPRNALIRAHRTDAAPPDAAALLDELIASWSVEPRLLELLGRGGSRRD